MYPRRTIFLFVALAAALGGVLLRGQPQGVGGQADPVGKREAAYRENNIGVARLEQFDAKSAVANFRKALAITPDLVMARVNLAIAQFYVPDLPAARKAAEAAAQAAPDVPHAHYILGLIAKSENRTNEGMAAFTRVLEIDPQDVGALVNLGQLEMQERRYKEAQTLFERAVEAEPYNATATYNLAVSLMRGGSRDAGAKTMKRFQALRETGSATTFSNAYLEQGRYAAAMVSTGAEPELVDETIPAVTFTAVPDALPATPAVEGRASSGPGGGVTLLDLDHDGDLDLVHAEQTLGVKLYSNDGGRFSDVSRRLGLDRGDESIGAFAVIGGDYDNDGRTDLFALGANEQRLLWQGADGRFQDRTKAARIPKPVHPYRAASFVDVDHDGDLDLLLLGWQDDANTVLLRNNGDGTFADTAKAAHLEAAAGSQVIPTDFDNRRDVDLLVVGGTSPVLFRNLRDGTFRDVATEVGLLKAAASAPAAADVNKDGYTDFFFGVNEADARSELVLSTGDGRFEPHPSAPQAGQVRQPQFIDYDNDGLLDLVVLTEQGFRLWRNLGARWEDVSPKALPDSLRRRDSEHSDQGYGSFASGDLDGDGDTDLVVRGPDGIATVWQNDGGNANRSVQVQLTAQVSNRSAYGAKIEMRAGSLWQKLEHVSAWPAPAPGDIAFGLGERPAADVVRVLWPAGILQAEIPSGPTDAPQRVSLTELDRKPSSCPYLFTWNGDRFEFVTDFLGGGEMGYLLAPGVFNMPDPVEYVRIRGDQLTSRDGQYEIRMTNELEETLYLDHVRLAAVTHPADVEVYPNEGMTHTPKPFRLFVVKDARPPLSAIDGQGRDVTKAVARLDRQFADELPVEKIRGYAKPHTLTLDLGRKPDVARGLQASRTNTRPVADTSILLLTGWTDYAFSSDNVAAHQAGLELVPPALQMKDEHGRWRTVIDDIGIPVGRPQTVPVDLTGKWLSDSREVRILTSMRVYWDQIRVATPVTVIETPDDAEVTWFDPVLAELRWRGFSVESAVTDDGSQPLDFEYSRVTFTSPWKRMRGHYTRGGDVRPLLQTSDDKFVIARPGDEIALSFDAASTTRLPAGLTQTFLLYADGFSKEMDLSSASPDSTLPLPFHRMTGYPYPATESYPDTPAHRRYRAKYNTRFVGRQIAPVEEALQRR